VNLCLHGLLAWSVLLLHPSLRHRPEP
jgi:hypothetical protein